MLKEAFQKIDIPAQKIGGFVIIATLLATFGFTACKSSKRTETISLVNEDPAAKGLEFIDSLKAAEHSPLIGFYKGCVDCQPYSNIPYYVFWKANDTWFVTKFDRRSRYNILKAQTSVLSNQRSYLDSLKNEKLVVLKLIKSAYAYEQVLLIMKDLEIDYRIKDYEREYNTNTRKLALTDKIKSRLMQIPKEDWKALDY